MRRSQKQIRQRSNRLESLESRDLLTMAVAISEIMAHNHSTLADEDGEFSDWIELHNLDGSAVNLSGWHLSDDVSNQDKWALPDKVLAPDEFLVIFASGKDRRDTNSQLHTNFKLKKSGEYLALVDPNGVAVDRVFSPEYPAQLADISFGLSGESLRQVYFTAPTPGASNSIGELGITSEVVFSLPHGFYRDEFLLQLSTPNQNETIRYTLDGSQPTSEHGAVYTEPIPVRGTTPVRAAAFNAGHLTHYIATQTYIFIEDTIRQNNADAIAGGLPSQWGEDQWGEIQLAHYEMSQRLIGQQGTDDFDGVYAETVRDDLVAVPTISIVMNQDEMFGENGLISNPTQRGREWEREGSIELIDPDADLALETSSGFQIDAGIRIQGNISRGSRNPKKSFRLFFRQRVWSFQIKLPAVRGNQVFKV